MPLLCTSFFSLLHDPKTPSSTATPSVPFLLPSPPLSRRRPPRHPTFHLRHCPHTLTPLRSLPDRPPSSTPPLVDLVEKDWSFLDAGSDLEDADEKARRIICAGEVGEESRVLVAFGMPAFVDRLVEQCPSLGLLLVVHDSLFALAMVKEKHDRVRCWQGPVKQVPEKFSPFDVVFVCYFPGMGVSVDELLGSVAARCSPGARVVVSFEQGREIVEQVHKQQYPEMVTSVLPDRISLEKAAANHSFQLTEFVDDPAFYLAVVKFC